MMGEERIEQIVREVLRRLAASAADDASLRLDTRLVTLDTVADKLDGLRKVIVSRTTVVTPSVKDVLRHNNIELVRASERPADGNSAFHLLIAQMTNTIDQPHLENVGCHVEIVSLGSVEATLKRLKQHTRRSASLAAVVTDQPETFTCQANRHKELRAFHGFNADTVYGGVGTLKANVMVTQSSAKSFGLLRQFVQESMAAGTAS